MSARDEARVREFEIGGDVAYAWYFVVAHWPVVATSPQLRTESGPIRLAFNDRPEVLYTLRRTLMGAAVCGGSLGESASKLIGQLGSLLPEEAPPQKHSSEAG